jgi:hypothetical protein
MSNRIAISFAAIAIGMSCIATDALAGSRGWGGPMRPPSVGRASFGPIGAGAVYRPSPRLGAIGSSGALAGGRVLRPPSVGGAIGPTPQKHVQGASGGPHHPVPYVTGAGGPTGGGAAGFTGSGAAGFTGGGAAAGARYYAPALYDSNAAYDVNAAYESNAADEGNAVACGRYPYPPCKKVRTRVKTTE